MARAARRLRLSKRIQATLNSAYNARESIRKRNEEYRRKAEIVRTDNLIKRLRSQQDRWREDARLQSKLKRREYGLVANERPRVLYEKERNKAMLKRETLLKDLDLQLDRTTQVRDQKERARVLAEVQRQHANMLWQEQQMLRYQEFADQQRNIRNAIFHSESGERTRQRMEEQRSLHEQHRILLLQSADARLRARAIAAAKGESTRETNEAARLEAEHTRHRLALHEASRVYAFARLDDKGDLARWRAEKSREEFGRTFGAVLQRLTVNASQMEEIRRRAEAERQASQAMMRRVAGRTSEELRAISLEARSAEKARRQDERAGVAEALHEVGKPAAEATTISVAEVDRNKNEEEREAKTRERARQTDEALRKLMTIGEEGKKDDEAWNKEERRFNDAAEERRGRAKDGLEGLRGMQEKMGAVERLREDSESHRQDNEQLREWHAREAARAIRRTEALAEREERVRRSNEEDRVSSEKGRERDLKSAEGDLEEIDAAASLEEQQRRKKVERRRVEAEVRKREAEKIKHEIRTDELSLEEAEEHRRRAEEERAANERKREKAEERRLTEILQMFRPTGPPGPPGPEVAPEVEPEEECRPPFCQRRRRSAILATKGPVLAGAPAGPPGGAPR